MNPLRRLLFALPCSLALLLVLSASPMGCGGSSSNNNTDAGSDAGSDAGTLDGPAILGWLDCDPLVPTQCGFPFPSNVYLTDDATTPTGKHVHFGKTTLPKYFKVAHMDRALYEDLDGFSPASAPLMHLPGATLTGCAGQNDIGTSLTATSPTVLIEADTGTLVPHWVEFDKSTTDTNDQTFMMRPAVRLKDATRYIVAIRNIKNASGMALTPSPVFQALRDGTPSNDLSVEPRRALYTDIFAKLSAAGVAKTDLQLAWDFTTSSKANHTQWMIAMRDDALGKVGTDGPAYTITKKTDNPNSYIRLRIEGTFKAPLYLDKADPGAHMNLVNGVPTQNGTMDVPFLVQIPNSVATDTVGAPIVQQGHGLLGDKTEGENSYFAQLAQNKKYVTIAIDLI
ncbi:MAG: hypothetical protein JST92_24480, partial [Deltaproteobacteria bacterium]|nr:hypothetical protein [Deltaproteobacteria bacterium]